MNNTEYDIFQENSYWGLTWSQHLRLIFAGLGIITNLVNILVFFSSKLQDITYKYMLATSANNFLFLCTHFAIVFLNLCDNCPSSSSYMSGVLTIALGYYLQNCLAVLRMLLEITISIRIYLILQNKTFDRISYRLVLLILTATALVFYIQQPFSYIVVASNKAGTSYSTKPNNFGDSSFAKWLIVGQFSVRIILTLFVLSAINIITVFEFRKRFRIVNIPFKQISLSSLKNKNKPASTETNYEIRPKSKIYLELLSLEKKIVFK